ncbi:PH domain-containing protein [Subtercola frigoramans]|uniref:Membrane protein YdbT with pleckstrin-like domain n=1 Tax=Subtercola frigoramans TaxID=120298 RepID=A0ABS2L885_9MICO|nr:PH domain-containing protein [Subtercola frigoramans]MBM7473307.1 putative membrane protein YdbT with pleckstrin-like domain [Subtercola frigoramans]
MTNDITTTVRGPEAPELVIARYRSHGRRLFWPVLVLMAVAAASGYYLGRLPEEWQNLTALGAAIALTVLLGLLPTIAWLARRYTVTNRRVIAVHGVFVRERQEVSLRRGFDVTVRRRGLQAVFRSGDVTIHSGTGHPLVLKDVPDAGLIVRALTDLGDDGFVRTPTAG